MSTVCDMSMERQWGMSIVSGGLFALVAGVSLLFKKHNSLMVVTVATIIFIILMKLYFQALNDLNKKSQKK